MSSIAVVGLGKLGACMAGVLARDGHDVVGVDVNENTVNTINGGFAPVDEPGLNELVHRSQSLYNLRATTDYRDAVGKTEMAFVVVPTPSKADDYFDNAHVVAAVSNIAAALAEGCDYTIAVVSTVMPGSMGGEIREAAGSVSLAYTPAFIALGSVIRDLTHPDLLLIGSDDPSSPGTRAVAKVLAQMSGGTATAHHMSLLEAEVTKLSINCYLSTKIAVANEVGMLCETIGADGMKVLRAMGADSRIGSKLLSPGGIPAGPCLPRDTKAMRAYAERLGSGALMAETAMVLTEATLGRIRRRIYDTKPMLEPLTVGILGLGYKPGSPIMDESVATRLIEDLLEPSMVPVSALAYDAHVSKEAFSAMYPEGLPRMWSAQKVVDYSDVVLVATAEKEFAELDYGDTKVIDLWGVVPKGENVHRFGVGR